MSVLRIRGLTKSFGGVKAVDDVSFNVAPGEIVGLIGPNGAGKTTLLNIISGIVALDSGEVFFLDHNVTNKRPDKIAVLGIARTFQIPKPLKDLSVIENVMVGSLFGGSYKKLHEARELAMSALEKVELDYKAYSSCKEISTGETKKMEFARALIMEPKLMILDEPLAGVGVSEVNVLVNLIKHMASNGCAVLIVEHVMRVVWNISDRIIVMHHGKKILDSTPQEAACDKKVIQAYLGERYVAKSIGNNDNGS